MTPPVTASACTATSAFPYSGTLTASAPGTVSYQWVYSAGKQGPVQTAHFAAAGDTQVTGEVVKTTQPGGGWGEIQLLSPARKTSNQASYKLLCAASAGGFTPAASVTPSTPARHLRHDTAHVHRHGSITSAKAATVAYYWALSNGLDSAPATVTFTKAGHAGGDAADDYPAGRPRQR